MLSMCIYQCDLVNVSFSDMLQERDLYKTWWSVVLTNYTMHGYIQTREDHVKSQFDCLEYVPIQYSYMLFYVLLTLIQNIIFTLFK